MAFFLTCEQVILLRLRGGDRHSLQDIYGFIEWLKEEHDERVNPDLYSVNPAYGNRPRYTHDVRATIHTLRKKGFVERVGKGKRDGVYRMTALGEKRLETIGP